MALKEFTKENLDQLREVERQYYEDNWPDRNSPNPFHKDDDALFDKLQKSGEVNNDVEFSARAGGWLYNLTETRYKAAFSKDFANNFDEYLEKIGFKLTDAKEKAAYISALTAYSANSNDYIDAQVNDLNNMLDDGPEVFNAAPKDDPRYFSAGIKTPTDAFDMAEFGPEKFRINITPPEPKLVEQEPEPESEPISFDTLVDDSKPKKESSSWFKRIDRSTDPAWSLTGMVADVFNAFHKLFVVTSMSYKTGMPWSDVSTYYDAAANASAEERQRIRKDTHWDPHETDEQKWERRKEDTDFRIKYNKSDAVRFDGKPMLDVPFYDDFYKKGVERDLEDELDDELVEDDPDLHNDKNDVSIGSKKEDEVEVKPGGPVKGG